MLIDSMLVYHFVDSYLRVEIFFEKEGTTENGGIYFEIGDIGLSAHLYWMLKKISCRACLLFYYILFGEKKVSSKAVPDVLNMKYGSGFNRGCLQGVVLKALHNSKEIRDHKSRDMQLFPSKCLK